MAYCKNCANALDPLAAVCMSCGFAAGTGQRYCANCGRETPVEAAICTNCGFPTQAVAYNMPYYGQEQKSKMAAGLLGIFLGSYGVHNFYLGFKQRAVLQLSLSLGGLLLSIITCGITAFLPAAIGVWGLIEGIMILSGSVAVDGNGVPLKD